MRLFIAITIAESLRETLSKWQPVSDKHIRPVAQHQLHLTLHFLGEQDCSIISSALEQVEASAFEITLNKTGIFKTSGNRAVLWAGVEQSAPLDDLYQKIGKVLAQNGVELDHRAYRPHITLARCKRGYSRTRVQQFLDQATIPQRQRVDQFCLYCSKFIDNIASYQVLRSYPLTA